MKVLVIAAHPDDEILGAGGTICKHIAHRDDVYICVVTKAYEPQWSKECIETRLNEQKEVDHLLGVTQRFNLDFPTVKLNTLPHGELNKKVTDIIDFVQPNIVYTHFGGDINYDHTLVFQACMVATRPPKKMRLMCYETLSETEWGNSVFSPNVWIDIGEFIEKKVDAFNVYKSELKENPHPRNGDGIRIQARKRGMDACMYYAEAFSLIRDYW